MSNPTGQTLITATNGVIDSNNVLDCPVGIVDKDGTPLLADHVTIQANVLIQVIDRRIDETLGSVVTIWNPTLTDAVPFILYARHAHSEEGDPIGTGGEPVPSQGEPPAPFQLIQPV